MRKIRSCERWIRLGNSPGLPKKKKFLPKKFLYNCPKKPNFVYEKFFTPVFILSPEKSFWSKKILCSFEKTNHLAHLPGHSPSLTQKRTFYPKILYNYHTPLLPPPPQKNFFMLKEKNILSRKNFWRLSEKKFFSNENNFLKETGISFKKWPLNLWWISKKTILKVWNITKAAKFSSPKLSLFLR